MRLMHPQHGWHVVSAADDVAAMRRAGWVDDDGKALAAKLSALAPGPVVEPATKDGDDHIALVKDALVKSFPDGVLAAPAKRGPGRPRKVAANGA